MAIAYNSQDLTTTRALARRLFLMLRHRRHQHRHENLLQVCGGIGLRDGNDAVVMHFRAAHHASASPILNHGLGRIEERVTNGTMARSSARRSIKKKKAGGHYAADLVLQLPARGSGSVALHSVLLDR
jgi:hypothetical protein